METYTKFDLASDLVNVHKAITRATQIAASEGKDAFSKRETDVAQYNGYILYVECLMHMLHEHHGNEEKVAFPLLQKIIPAAPYDKLIEQHENMLSVMKHIEAILPHCKSGTPTPGQQEQLLAELEELREIWQTHIDLEELHFGPDTISPDISTKDRVKIGKASARYAQTHSKPIPLMVPFLLYNLEGQDRALMAETIPGFIINFLVPKLWKPKWESMSPYLLVHTGKQ